MVLIGHLRAIEDLISGATWENCVLRQKVDWPVIFFFLYYLRFHIWKGKVIISFIFQLIQAYLVLIVLELRQNGILIANSIDLNLMSSS